MTTTTTKKFSEITPAGTDFTDDDVLIGVTGTGADRTWTRSELANAMGSGEATTDYVGVTPLAYGGLGDGSGDLITQADINTHLTDWFGIYEVGTTWDTVGVQEAIYHAFAPFSAVAPANGIKVQSSVDTLGLGDQDNLVNGTTGVGVVQLTTRSGAAYTVTSRNWIRFFFRAGPTVITEATWYQSDTSSHGTWRWQGSNNGADYAPTWTNIGSTFTLGGSATQVQTSLSANTTAYQFYRLLGVSGTSSSSAFLREVQFKQAGAYVTGNRRNLVFWNVSAGNQYNERLFIPGGQWIINQNLFLVANHFHIEFQQRQLTGSGAGLIWQGTDDRVFISCPSLAYGSIYNLAMSAPEFPCHTFFDMQGSTGYGGLSTQQLTFYDLAIDGGGWSSYAVDIAHSNSQQGDTVLFINPYIANFREAGLAVGGQNALDIQIVEGDFQHIDKDAIQLNSGTVIVHGTSFQNEAASVIFSPATNQIVRDGADVRQYAGQGSTNITVLRDIRSESDILMMSDVVTGTIKDCAMAAAGFNDWFVSYPYQIGMLLNPSTNNTKKRQFIVVDDSGDVMDITTGWKDVDEAGSTGSVIKDGTGVSYSVNQWVGYALFFRFSNGFTAHDTILSNTSNTFTVATNFGTPNPLCTYHIGGYTAASAPNFDGASNGHVVFTGATSQGITLTAGSAQIGLSSQFTEAGISVGDYVVVPNATLFGFAPPTNGAFRPQYKTAFCAKILSSDGGGLYTVSKTAPTSVSFGTAYFGTPLVDNKISYIELAYPCVRNAISVEGSYFKAGLAYNAGHLHATTFEPLAWNGDERVGNLTSPPPLTYEATNSVKYYGALLAPANWSTSSTLDLTSLMQSYDRFDIVPVGSQTLNAPAPLLHQARRLTFNFTSSGTTSFTITFGTNFASQGTIVTGTTTGAKFGIVFESAIDGSSVPTWREVSRSPVTVVRDGTISTAVITNSSLNLLNTLTPAQVGSSVDTTSLTAAYNRYRITFENVCPVSTATLTCSLNMQIATSGVAWVSANYVSTLGGFAAATSFIVGTTSMFYLSGITATTCVGTSTSYGVNGWVDIANPASTVFRKSIVGSLDYITPGAVSTLTNAQVSPGGFWDGGASAITGIAVAFQTGNIATGTIRIYGIK